jgi:hypothetical protein
MALAMQQAMDFLPSDGHVVAQLALQPWWRDGVAVVAMCYLADQTWELTVLYAERMYAVVYDALDGRCDAIEPVDVDD